MSDFDSLYNEYFGDNEENEPKIPKSVERMFDLVEQLNKDRENNEDVSEEDALGEPTSRRIVLLEGTKFEETIWETPEGSIVRMKAVDPQNIDMEKLSKIGGIINDYYNKGVELRKQTPEELLEEAVESEDYEEAAKLRDIIFGKTEKKNEKKESSENLNNKGFPEDDEWNF